MELHVSQKCYIKSQNRDKNNTPEAVCKTMNSKHMDFNIWFSLKGTYCDCLYVRSKVKVFCFRFDLLRMYLMFVKTVQVN